MRSCSGVSQHSIALTGLVSPPCLLVASSPLVTEMLLARVGFAPTVARPLSMFAKAPTEGVGPLPRVALVLADKAGEQHNMASVLMLLAGIAFPLELVYLPASSAWAPPLAIGAVLFPWALASAAFYELFMIQMPLLVPSAEYLAELSCARDAIDMTLDGLASRWAKSPSTGSLNWQAPDIIQATRCGSFSPALAALRKQS